MTGLSQAKDLKRRIKEPEGGIQLGKIAWTEMDEKIKGPGTPKWKSPSGKKSFEKMLPDITVLQSWARCVRGIDILCISSLKYIDITFKVLNATQKCCARETRGLCPFIVSGKKGRSHAPNIVDHHRFPIYFCLIMARYPGYAIVSTGKYFISSFKNEAEFSGKSSLKRDGRFAVMIYFE